MDFLFPLLHSLLSAGLYHTDCIPTQSSLWEDLAGPLGIFFIVFVAVLVIISLLALVLYVFQSLALYSMAKNQGIIYPWLAFIPVANQYLLGALAGDTVALGSLVLPYAATVLPVAGAATTILSSVTLNQNYFASSFATAVFAIFVAVYGYALYYRLFLIYKRESATGLLILSVFIPIALPFILFTLRGRAADFSGLEKPRPRHTNPRALTALALALCGLIGAGGSGHLLICVAAIVLGCVAYRECRASGDPVTLAILAIAVGAGAILIGFIIQTSSFIDTLYQPKSMLDEYFPGDWDHYLNDDYPDDYGNFFSNLAHLPRQFFSWR